MRRNAPLSLLRINLTWAVLAATLLGFALDSGAFAATSDAASLLLQDRFQQLDEEFSSIQQSFEMGRITGDEDRNAFRAFYPTDPDLAVKYDRWVTAFPRSYVARLGRAIYYKKRGFEERGGKVFSETSAAQIQGMNGFLDRAIKDFGDSISMTAKPFLSYLHMLDISSSYVPPAYSRKLYDSAVALDARSFAVRQKYMSALTAKWGGSLEEMRQFLEECRTDRLTTDQLRQLESMVYEDEGWERDTDGDSAGAEAAYRKAISVYPPECTSCLVSSLVDVLMKEQKYADAIVFLNDFLNQKPVDIWALSNRGLALFQTGNPTGAFADWSIAAKEGDSFAQNRLGVLYMTGIAGHLPADAKAGIAWLERSAAQGNVEAQRNLPIALAQKNAPADGP